MIDSRTRSPLLATPKPARALRRERCARPRSGGALTPLVVVTLLCALGWGAWRALGTSDGKVVVLEGVDVRRGDLRISIVERGNLESADSSELRNETDATVTIVWIIEEGKWVQEGDLVCELDVVELQDDLFLREISVRNAEAAYVKSEQQYEIQKSQNESDAASAKQALAFAKQDLEKFLQADRMLQLAEADEAVTIADEEFERAKADLSWSEKLHERGFQTKTELDADRLALTRSEIGLDQKQRVRQSLIDFELPKLEAELRAALEEAEREVLRVRLQATAQIADNEADLRTNEAKLKLERDKLANVEKQIAAGKLYADRPGMAVYAKESGGRYGRDDPIEKGTSVRPRQAIITIPKAGGMVAQASLHESVLKQVRAGLLCQITVDAVPERTFRGRVKSVAVLPDQNSWYANPNQRLYKTQVDVIDASEELRPGMSCSVEIMVEDIEDALHVPVQSVFKDGGDNIVFVHARGLLEKRVVTVGAYNDRWVEIRSGLVEGETVTLSAPADFAPRSTPEERRSEDEEDEDLPLAPAGSSPESSEHRGAGPEGFGSGDAPVTTPASTKGDESRGRGFGHGDGERGRPDTDAAARVAEDAELPAATETTGAATAASDGSLGEDAAAGSNGAGEVESPAEDSER